MSVYSTLRITRHVAFGTIAMRFPLMSDEQLEELLNMWLEPMGYRAEITTGGPEYNDDAKFCEII